METNDIATVATTADIVEAEILKSRLGEAGITVYLGDEGIIGAHGLLSNAVGGVKIRVAVSDYESALEIVREQRKPRTPSNNPKINTGWGICPQCECKNLKPYREALGWKGIFLLLGFIVVRPKRMLNCNVCDYSWQYR